MNNSIAQINLLDLQFLGINFAIIGTLALILIMITMGLTLENKDFKLVYRSPRAVVIGLIGQLVLLPACAFLIAYLFGASEHLAVGLIILACCPGGATSNFFTYLAKGDVALSVVLTALSGLIVVFTIPFIINYALSMFSQSDAVVQMPVLKSMAQIFALVVLPVAIGMYIKAKLPTIAQLIQKPATNLSFFLVVFTMAVIFYEVMHLLPQLFKEAGLMVAALNVTMMIIGFLLSRLATLSEPHTRSIVVEIGVQNYLLSIVIAITMLNAPQLTVVPVVYLFVMYITVFSFIYLCRSIRQHSLVQSTK